MELEPSEPLLEAFVEDSKEEEVDSSIEEDMVITFADIL